MSLLQVKKDFTRRELLWFGPLLALFGGMLGLIAIHRFAAPRAAYTIWIVAAVVIIVYYLIPSLQKPLYRGWIYAVLPIGWVISHVLLLCIYYLLLTSVGLLMRLCGYDPLQRRFDRAATSYWIVRPQNPPADKSRYFKQY